jgi:hypothetical protein
MTVLPLILAPAALVALAPQPAIQGPLVEGLVLNQAGKPLPASIGLIPMFQREEPFPMKTVENQVVKSKSKTPGFQLPIPAPGLYLLDIRGRGCQPIQVPVLLGENGLKGLEVTPVPDKAKGEVKPITADANLLKLASVYAAHREREALYRKAVKARFEKKAASGAAESGPVVDWTADLEALTTDLKNEKDADILSLAAVCYLDLGSKMAKLDPEVAALALDQLPASSPWWAFNPRSAGTAFAAANRSADWMPFREALSKDNPDNEVRAYGYYSQAASAFNKGDKEKFTALFETLTTDYKTTKYAKSAKAFDPAKMPTPSTTTPADVPPVPPPATEVPAAPTPAAPAPIPIENPIPAPAPPQP